MAVKIYNSLTSRKEEFIPLHPGQASIYVCGPTVYDDSHIGHLRAAYVFDFIRRYLEFSGLKVRMVRNITDVDDKIINRARTEAVSKSGLDDKVREIAARYTESYERDLAAFGILPPEVQPRATEHIPDMIEMISELIDKEMAYAADGDVYFRVRKFTDYGKLSHQSADQMIAGSRIGPEGNKLDPLDFALWKQAKPEEPSWESPWGRGRPGWHIECSVMSTRYLGPEFDIHGGGRDLIFPHHENEIAQAQGAGRPFARYWIHNGLVTVENEKMSKSLNNFVTLNDVIHQASVDALKVLFLSSHYSHPVDYSKRKLEESESALKRFSVFFSRVEDFKKTGGEAVSLDKKSSRELERFSCRFQEAMEDDFNTAEALAVLFEVVNSGNKTFEDESLTVEAKKGYLVALSRLLKSRGEVLGLFQSASLGGEDELVGRLMEIIIEVRRYLREKKEYRYADLVRARLNEAGVILEDKKEKTTWRRGM